MDISNFSQGDLILFCILKVEQVKEDCTFERLVYECFTTFPDRFSFYTYRLPDSIKLDRQLRTLRKLRLISGNNKYGFKLTESGYRLATQLQKYITSTSLKSPQKENGAVQSKNIKGGRKEKIMINKIISSSLYKKYEIDTNVPLNADEVRIVFFGTLETPLKSLLDNIEYIEKIAKKSDDLKLVSFIDKCKKFIRSKEKG